MKWTLVLSIALLCGCGTNTPPPAVIRTVEVKVPVKQPCVPAGLDGAPSYPDTNDALLSAGDAAARYLLMGAGRALRIARLSELETVVAGCR